VKTFSDLKWEYEKAGVIKFVYKHYDDDFMYDILYKDGAEEVRRILGKEWGKPHDKKQIPKSVIAHLGKELNELFSQVIAKRGEEETKVYSKKTLKNVEKQLAKQQQKSEKMSDVWLRMLEKSSNHHQTD
jgi:NTP pyrophosphatase (non-canonical NTP hydrolase)